MTFEEFCQQMDCYNEPNPETQRHLLAILEAAMNQVLLKQGLLEHGNAEGMGLLNSGGENDEALKE